MKRGLTAWYGIRITVEAWYVLHLQVFDFHNLKKKLILFGKQPEKDWADLEPKFSALSQNDQ
jgi:Na+-transporting NADH:ubiquinone oxidoreductase subunit NqrF